MSSISEKEDSGSDIPKKVYLMILSISFIWLVLIIFIPMLMYSGGLSAKISSYGYQFFSTVCHQQDERSFHLFEHKLAVCSRCVSIYAGFFLGTALYPLKFRLNNFITPSVWILILAVSLILIDVILDITGIFANTFYSRSVTGFITGFVLPLYLIPGFVKFFSEVYSFLRNKASTQ
jgi:uncharacterized membrane protein